MSTSHRPYLFCYFHLSVTIHSTFVPGLCHEPSSLVPPEGCPLSEPLPRRKLDHFYVLSLPSRYVRLPGLISPTLTLHTRGHVDDS